MEMKVSSMTRTDNSKAVYVQFIDGVRKAEFAIPGCNMVSSSGFSQEELKQLRDYVDNEQDYIFSVAKNVSPMKGFMGKKQGE